jgi:hypothetical protein
MNIFRCCALATLCFPLRLSGVDYVPSARADQPPTVDAAGLSQIVPLGEAPGFEGNVAATHADGTVELTPRDKAISSEGLIEGLYVFMGVRKSADDKRPFDPLGAGRCEVSEVGDSGITVALSGAARGKLQAGDIVVLFRPPAFSTSRMKAIPDWTPLVEQLTEPAPALTDLGARAVAEYRLTRIGRAIAAYAEQHRVLPPAATAGPDGKPWHSWRVLILPYLGEKSLYDRYRFDQPWDGPENKKLLAEMPDAYRDPAYGSQDGEFTHFAACVGDHAALVAGPLKADADGKPDHDAPGHRTWGDFKDGPTFCIIAGSVADGQIPWTKPDDVSLDENLPPPGGAFPANANNRSTTFAAPHEAIFDKRIRGGVFLFGASGSGIPEVATFTTEAHARRFRAALSIDDGTSPSRPDELLPQFALDNSEQNRPTLEFVVESGKAKAVLRRPGQNP